MSPHTGKYFQPEIVCIFYSCPEELVCGEKIETELFLTKFDSFSLSSLQVFTVLTLEGWSEVMRSTMTNLSEYTWIYFLSLIILGNYILVNLTLAILKVEFTNSRKNLEKEKLEVKREYEFNLQELRFSKIWNKNKSLSFDFVDTYSPSQTASDKIATKPVRNRYHEIDLGGNSFSNIQKKRSSLKKFLAFLENKKGETDMRFLKIKVMDHLPYNGSSKKDILGRRY
jgi:hypothetical protein